MASAALVSIYCLNGAVTEPVHGNSPGAEVYSQQVLLARRHAPDYFASWASEGGDGAGDGAKL